MSNLTKAPATGDLTDLGKLANDISADLYDAARLWDSYITGIRRTVVARLIALGMAEPDAEAAARALAVSMSEAVSALKHAASGMATVTTTADAVTDEASKAQGRATKVSLRGVL